MKRPCPTYGIVAEILSVAPDIVGLLSLYRLDLKSAPAVHDG